MTSGTARNAGGPLLVGIGLMAAAVAAVFGLETCAVMPGPDADMLSHALPAAS